MAWEPITVDCLVTKMVAGVISYTAERQDPYGYLSCCGSIGR